MKPFNLYDDYPDQRLYVRSTHIYKQYDILPLFEEYLITSNTGYLQNWLKSMDQTKRNVTER